MRNKPEELDRKIEGQSDNSERRNSTPKIKMPPSLTKKAAKATSRLPAVGR